MFVFVKKHICVFAENSCFCTKMLCSSRLDIKNIANHSCFRSKFIMSNSLFSSSFFFLFCNPGYERNEYLNLLAKNIHGLEVKTLLFELKFSILHGVPCLVDQEVNQRLSFTSLPLFSVYVFSRIKKIPYQAPPTQLGPRKCTF